MYAVMFMRYDAAWETELILIRHRIDAAYFNQNLSLDKDAQTTSLALASGPAPMKSISNRICSQTLIILFILLEKGMIRHVYLVWQMSWFDSIFGTGEAYDRDVKCPALVLFPSYPPNTLKWLCGLPKEMSNSPSSHQCHSRPPWGELVVYISEGVFV